MRLNREGSNLGARLRSVPFRGWRANGTAVKGLQTTNSRMSLERVVCGEGSRLGTGIKHSGRIKPPLDLRFRFNFEQVRYTVHSRHLFCLGFNRFLLAVGFHRTA